jgi:hypothetical protein
VVEGYAVKWQEGALAILLQNNYSNWQIWQALNLLERTAGET